MKRYLLVAGVMMLAILAGPAARTAFAQGTEGYTNEERNKYVSAANEQNPGQKVRLLNEFVAQYPNSTLLPYAYRDYFLAYAALNNGLKVMEYADKLLALGEKVDSMQGLENSRLQASILRAQVFFPALNQRQLTTNEQFTTARGAAVQGLKLLDQLKKPENVSDEDFKKQTDGFKVAFHSVIGFSARQLKDFKGAIDAFRDALKISPNDAPTYYQIGLSYLQEEPPQQMNGFWAIARSIALKVQGEAQIRSYLRSQLLRYQQPACDSLLDAQLNELITLAAGSAERPENFSVPTREELNKVLADNGTVEAISGKLKEGGDTAKRTWLAACGAEFPELIGKVFEVSENSDIVVLKIFSASTQEATEAGTEPNLEVQIVGQPTAKNFKKDDLFVFAATLKNFTPEPFKLELDKGKVREDTLPPEVKAPPKKAPPKKAPARKRPPTKQ